MAWGKCEGKGLFGSGPLTLACLVIFSRLPPFFFPPGLEPEIQKLIAKHKLEIKKLKALHEAELLQSDERAAQRYVRQTEELKEMLEHEKEEQGQRERELARQRYEGSVT